MLDGEYRTYMQDHFSLCVSHTLTPLLRTPSAHGNHQQTSHSQQIPKHLLHADTALYAPRPGALPGAFIPAFNLPWTLLSHLQWPHPLEPALSPGPRSSCSYQEKWPPIGQLGALPLHWPAPAKPSLHTSVHSTRCH